MEKKAYKVFSSAGDINNATGNDYYKDYDINNADGDINNASGDILSECALNEPYPSTRLRNLLDMVSATRNAYAFATAAKEQAYKAWKSCKQKLFCRAGPYEDVLDAKESQELVAKQAFLAAEADLKQAEKANEEAESDFKYCQSQENIRLRDLQAQENILSEQQIEQQKVQGTYAQTYANISKEYLNYGFIGLGVIVVGFLSYKLIQ